MSVDELCVFHGAERAEVEDPFVCWEYDGSRDCAFVTHADLIAVVRRGVESGTIEGEEIETLDSMTFGPIVTVDDFGTYIVIGPVSDGGSET